MADRRRGLHRGKANGAYTSLSTKGKYCIPKLCFVSAYERVSKRCLWPRNGGCFKKRNRISRKAQFGNGATYRYGATKTKTAFRRTATTRRGCACVGEDPRCFAA